MKRKDNDANFFVEKYAIARDAAQFEKDAQARDAMLFFGDARPALVFFSNISSSISSNYG